MKKMITILAAVLATALVSGCASEPTAADLLKGQINDAQKKVDLQKALLKDIQKGNKLVKDGQENVKDGEDDLKDAQKQIEKGNKLVAEGTAMVEKSKQTLKEHFPEINLETIK